MIASGYTYQFGIETERLKTNPTRGVVRFKVNRRERYLSERELASFSEALVEFERKDGRLAVMADAVRLLIFTGCRKNEILKLRWDWIDWKKGCIRLPDSKTGARVVPLADTALELLRRRWDEGRPPPPSLGHNSGDRPAPTKRSPFVLPALKGDGHFVGLPHLWEKVRVRADVSARDRATERGEDPDDVRTSPMSGFTSCATALPVSSSPTAPPCSWSARCSATNRRARPRSTPT